MSNIVRKGDFLVFVENSGIVTEFFVSRGVFDLDDCRTGVTGRPSVPDCFGFIIRSGHYYHRRDGYWITRKATLEERERFLRWMEEKGHKFNLNTLELTLNR
jgi:hypothetical protein